MSDTSDGGYRDLLVTEVPATVWSRSLAAALSGEAVDPGEELLPAPSANSADADEFLDVELATSDEDSAVMAVTEDAPADEPTAFDPAPLAEGWSNGDDVNEAPSL